MSTIALIIPAAGSGSRLEKKIAKPYLKLGGKTILEHTIGRFLGQEGLLQIVIATSVRYMRQTQDILDGMVSKGVAAAVVEGGAERQYSIFNALNKVGDVDLVIVHDAVRPFVTSAQIQACCATAAEVDGAVLGVPAKDTIKRVTEDGLIRETPSRRHLWQAQTPQVFKKEVLLKAYEKALEEGFIGTDDASLVERLGYSVKMVEGDRMNFKITYPLDLTLAQLLLENAAGHE